MREKHTLVDDGERTRHDHAKSTSPLSYRPRRSVRGSCQRAHQFEVRRTSRFSGPELAMLAPAAERRRYPDKGG